MARACFSRREQARLCRVAQAPKAVDDVGKSQIEVTLDVLAPDPFWLHLVDDAGHVGPEMPAVGVAASSAGVAEGLAGITGRHEMNSAAPRSAIKGSQIAPDRRLTQGLVCHPRHESGRSVAFPLDESHSAVPRLGDVEAEIEAGISGAEGDAPQLVELGAEVGM